ncbi:MAG: PhzF family phenazine biosynthesis protein [Planctomycetota bacterium]
MKLALFIVDAFTEQPYAGNPAGVVLMPSARDPHWMQEIATELNLSETAFVIAAEGGYRLQWFTPKMEVDLCGHATLASAHILWEQKKLRADQAVRFATRSGELSAHRSKDGWIEMDFPAELVRATKPTAQLAAAIGTPRDQIVWTGKSADRLLVELKTEKAVRALRPDPVLLPRLKSSVGVIVTARSSTPKYDFVSRYFAPRKGVFEDPVTGTAHCVLGPYWGPKLDKTAMTGYQASLRGGWVQVALAAKRVLLSGKAVTVVRGEIDA